MNWGDYRDRDPDPIPDESDDLNAVETFLFGVLCLLSIIGGVVFAHALLVA